VVFNPDSSMMALSLANGKVPDVNAMKVVRTLAADTVSDPSGKLIVTAGTDGTTRLWDARTGRPFGTTFPGFDNVSRRRRLHPRWITSRGRVLQRTRLRLAGDMARMGCTRL
jgi:WD40 repeat protein